MRSLQRNLRVQIKVLLGRVAKHDELRVGEALEDLQPTRNESKVRQSVSAPDR